MKSKFDSKKVGDTPTYHIEGSASLNRDNSIDSDSIEVTGYFCVVDNYLDRMFGAQLVAENHIKSALHISSGKLSASGLGAPLQWQILKSLGIFERVIDDYTLRKFERGNHIEKEYLLRIPGILVDRKYVEYRDCVGYTDVAQIDTTEWDYPCGIIPVEVKSVSNMKYKRIVAQMSPDRGHALQGALYALSEGSENFAVSYIASDDYRVLTFLLKTADWKPKVDFIIDRYQAQKATGKIPVFVPEEKWQASRDYNNFPDWSDLNEEQISEKIEQIYLQLAEELNIEE